MFKTSHRDFYKLRVAQEFYSEKSRAGYNVGALKVKDQWRVIWCAGFITVPTQE